MPPQCTDNEKEREIPMSEKQRQVEILHFCRWLTREGIETILV